jgi:hypothetical protein
MPVAGGLYPVGPLHRRSACLAESLVWDPSIAGVRQRYPRADKDGEILGFPCPNRGETLTTPPLPTLDPWSRWACALSGDARE